MRTYYVLRTILSSSHVLAQALQPLYKYYYYTDKKSETERD